MTDYNRAFPMAARAANWVAIAAASIALLLLALLHVVSPEFDPSWRMISEYANGKHGWILSLMFAFWGISQLALLLGIWRQQGKARFTIGLVFLFLSGASTAMASVFDVNHPLHDLASTFGILGLPVAAMLITGALGRSPGWSQAKTPLLWSAQLDMDRRGLVCRQLWRHGPYFSLSGHRDGSSGRADGTCSRGGDRGCGGDGQAHRSGQLPVGCGSCLAGHQIVTRGNSIRTCIEGAPVIERAPPFSCQGGGVV
jgi:hypothetical membrane protein